MSDASIDVGSGAGASLVEVVGAVGSLAALSVVNDNSVGRILRSKALIQATVEVVAGRVAG